MEEEGNIDPEIQRIVQETENRLKDQRERVSWTEEQRLAIAMNSNGPAAIIGANADGTHIAVNPDDQSPYKTVPAYKLNDSAKL